MIWAHFGYSGWMSDSSREKWEKLEKSENIMLGGAVGATEPRNTLGMVVVISLQLSDSIGGIEMIILKKFQNIIFLKIIKKR